MRPRKGKRQMVRFAEASFHSQRRRGNWMRPVGFPLSIAPPERHKSRPSTPHPLREMPSRFAAAGSSIIFVHSLESPSAANPVNEPLLNGNEAKKLAQCIKTGVAISSEGPFVRTLEEGMAAIGGQRHGNRRHERFSRASRRCCCTGRGLGDEVILPTFTIIACAAAIVRAGATPVVVDSDPLTWNIDPAQIEAKIHGRTRAIMVVHIYGLPVDMDPIMDLRESTGSKSSKTGPSRSARPI